LIEKVITRRLLPLHKSFFQPLLQASENPASHDDVARITESRSAVDHVTFATSQTAVIVKVVPHFHQVDVRKETADCRINWLRYEPRLHEDVVMQDRQSLASPKGKGRAFGYERERLERGVSVSFVSCEISNAKLSC
jgi:hypothetical protein